MLTERIRCDSIYKLSQDESSLKIKQLKISEQNQMIEETLSVLIVRPRQFKQFISETEKTQASK